ncbi:MAG: class I tRNA ligase family protein, partial [Thermofilaceae archaeon]
MAYQPKQVEQEILRFWETERIFKFDPKNKKKIFSIDTPPPTVSGKMHVGHAFNYTSFDVIARYKRMQGYSLFFPFGTDDNGLATERLIEKLKGV